RTKAKKSTAEKDIPTKNNLAEKNLALQGKEIDEPKTPKPDVGTPKLDVSTPKPNIDTPKLDVSTPKPNIDTPKLDVGTPKPNIDTPKPNIDTPKPNIDTPKPNIDTPAGIVEQMALAGARFRITRGGSLIIGNLGSLPPAIQKLFLDHP